MSAPPALPALPAAAAAAAAPTQQAALAVARVSAAPAAAAGALSPSYWRMAVTSPPLHKAFLGLTALQVVVVLAERATLASFAAAAPGGDAREEAYFGLVISLTAVFAAYFAGHAMLTANYWEMAAAAAANVLLLARVGVEFVNREAGECDALPGVCAGFLASEVALIAGSLGLAVGVGRDLAWKRYKAIGADGATRAMYRTYELWSAARKLDIQFSLLTLLTGFVFFRPAGASAVSTWALGVNAGLLAVEAGWEWAGNRAVKTEDAYLMYVFWMTSAFLPVYIVSVAVDAFTDAALLDGAPSASVRVTIGVMSALTLANRAATVGLSVVLFRAFGPKYVALRRLIATDRRGLFDRARVAKRVGAPAAAAGAAAVGAAAPGAAAPGGGAAAPAAAPGGASGAMPAGAGAVAVANPFAAAVAVAAAAEAGAGDAEVEDWAATSTRRAAHV